MSDALYYILSALLSAGVLLGVRWMSRVKTAVRGNRLSALCLLTAIIIILLKEKVLEDGFIWAGLIVGLVAGLALTKSVRMITIPQMVGLRNGLGGAACAIVSWLIIKNAIEPNPFGLLTAETALGLGALTFSGSMVAAGKLHRLLPQQPIRLAMHQLWAALSFALMLVSVLLAWLIPVARTVFSLITVFSGLAFGLLFVLPISGADLPITVSLLNSASGFAAAVAGMAIGNVLLVSVGGVVGASGFLLTQIMCRAMNCKLSSILLCKGGKPQGEAQPAVSVPAAFKESEPLAQAGAAGVKDLATWLAEAMEIVIIPGYGMAISQAQGLVKKLQDALDSKGKRVRFAIHPVAGRMPGHMNVLLAEVDVPYDKLFEMDEINPDMDKTDLAIVIGANDVVNPAANNAQDTPIYGMPVLDVEKAKRVIICNFDDKPGYSGVPNPLYQESQQVLLMFGDAKESLQTLLAALE